MRRLTDKETIGILNMRKKIIEESELKLDEEQTYFLLHGATDEQFNEMIEHLKQNI